MQPLVTVVIPTYNRLPLLPQAIGSVTAQTYSRWEVIVADDGSTDGTVDAICAVRDPRIRVVRLAHTGCIGRVRNAGVRLGTGELVAFLDSDDLWMPSKLEVQVAAMRESGARWCYAGFELMDEGLRTIPLRSGEWRPLSGRIVRELLTMDVAVTPVSLLMERALFEEVGRFTEETQVNEDWELNLRLALRADALAVPDVLVRIRDHPGRTTHVLKDSFERAARVYDLFLALDPPRDLAVTARRMRARCLADAGASRVENGEYGAAAQLFARALAVGLDPVRLARSLVRGLRSRVRRRSVDV